MGKIGGQKSFRFNFLSLLLVLTCFLLSAGFSVLWIHDLSLKNNALAAFDLNISWEQLDSDCFDLVDETNKVCYINSPNQLAYMAAVLSDSEKDYSGYTFKLEGNIKLNEMKYGDTFITPLWIPIQSKSSNFVFDGCGYSIIGMKIQYNDNTPRSLGFFSELTGGVIKDVTFLNPVIQYRYNGRNIQSDDLENRPNEPVDVSVGVIAGEVNSTYINNVKIENPIIDFTAENLNGHNFYIGGAVGKLLLNFSEDATSENKQILNTVTPKNWGLDTVNVVKNDIDSEITMHINAGIAEETYGVATSAYLGGLVGANISSKIINSTVDGLSIYPSFDKKTKEHVEGVYYVGAVAGLSAQKAKCEDLLVASGFYNNLIYDVSIDSTTIGEVDFGGKLVGKVVSGVWVYNNIVVGTNMYYDKLWQEVDNSAFVLVSSKDCLDNFDNGLDDYFFNDNDEYVDCKQKVDEITGIVFCDTHGKVLELNENEQVFSSSSNMEKYNFAFDTIESEEYKDFLIRFNNLNDFDNEDGYLYNSIIPIITYEIGLTINKINPNTNNESSFEDRRLDAIYQFKNWKYDSETLKPYLSAVENLDCNVVFFANESADDVSAYWLNDNEGVTEKSYELSVGRKYDWIYKPADPFREGYELLGWKIRGVSEASDEWNVFKNSGLINSEGFYVFGKERIIGQVIEQGRSFYAVWRPKTFKVTFIVRENDIDFVLEERNVTYNSEIGAVNSPVSQNNMSFVGWFLEEDLPVSENDDNIKNQWILTSSATSEATKMPAQDVILYSGWVDFFKPLKDLLYCDSYKFCYENFSELFDEVVGQSFYETYNAALRALEGNNYDTDILIKDLQSAFECLVVDSDKLLSTKPFDEALYENACPFLFDYASRIELNNLKKYILNTYLQFESGKVAKFVEDYCELIEKFNDLKNHLNKSVETYFNGELDLVAISDLVNKFNKTEELAEIALLNSEQYDSKSISKLNNAAIKARQLWTSEASNPNIKDVKLVVDAYENALNNLKPASSSSENKTDVSGNSTNAKTKASNAPIIIGGVLLGVMVLGVIVFILIDTLIYKRRVNGGIEKVIKAKSVKSKKEKIKGVQLKTVKHSDKEVNNMQSAQLSQQTIDKDVEDDEEYV